MAKRKTKPEKPERPRRKTDWWCIRCQRSLANDGQKHMDTVSGHENTKRVRFSHDQCDGVVKAIL